MLTQYMDEVIRLFGNPGKWADFALSKDIPGAERANVFIVSSVEEIDNLVATIIENKLKNTAVIGINPIGFAATFALKLQGCRVSMLLRGSESAAVKGASTRPETADFFTRHGVALHPRPAKRLKGSQVHCQSGYCGFVCEGRFIEESAEVGCVLTESGNVYADVVVIAEM